MINTYVPYLHAIIFGKLISEKHKDQIFGRLISEKHKDRHFLLKSCHRNPTETLGETLEKHKGTKTVIMTIIFNYTTVLLANLSTRMYFQRTSDIVQQYSTSKLLKKKSLNHSSSMYSHFTRFFVVLRQHFFNFNKKFEYVLPPHNKPTLLLKKLLSVPSTCLFRKLLLKEKTWRISRTPTKRWIVKR